MTEKSETFLFNRSWLLTLLEAAERNSITPVKMDTLHRYIYLANVLSPICQVTMPESYTLKHMRGPYFPQAQWDLGRLILQGLVEIYDFRPFSDDDGFWLSANYRITKLGIELVSNLSSHKSLLQQAGFLREFMSACSDIADPNVINIVESDFHYSVVMKDRSVVFSETEGNLSKVASSFMFPEDRVYTPSEALHRYVDYLYQLSINIGND